MASSSDGGAASNVESPTLNAGDSSPPNSGSAGEPDAIRKRLDAWDLAFLTKWQLDTSIGGTVPLLFQDGAALTPASLPDFCDFTAVYITAYVLLMSSLSPQYQNEYGGPYTIVQMHLVKHLNTLLSKFVSSPSLFGYLEGFVQTFVPSAQIVLSDFIQVGVQISYTLPVPLLQMTSQSALLAMMLFAEASADDEVPFGISRAFISATSSNLKRIMLQSALE